MERLRPARLPVPDQDASTSLPIGAGPGDAWGGFGKYLDAITRWESVTGRTAPPATENTRRDGGPQLSVRFTEWLMGLPDGWVTDPAIGISRNEQLKALGNGVVPAQCAEAIRYLLTQRKAHP